MANRPLAAPIVGLAATPTGRGYWLAAADGGIFTFGDARFSGSAVGTTAGQWVVDVVASPRDGYWVATDWGGVGTATPEGMRADPNLVPVTREERIASDVLARVNAERAARGLAPLRVDPFLQSAATSWARLLAATQTFAHQDLGAILRDAGGRFGAASENLFRGAGPGAVDAGTAHVSLMRSDGHRANILAAEARFAGIGVACEGGALVLVEDFAVPAGVAVAASAIPPLEPVAAPDTAGASC
jgi:hypothetical protein